MRARLALLCLVLAPAVCACGKRGTLYDERLAPLPPLAAGAAVVSVVPQTHRAVLLRPGAQAPEAVRISEGARGAAVSPSGEVVAILAGSTQAPVLDLLTVATGRVDSVATHGVFDAVSFSPDGTLALLTYSSTSQVPGLAARNLNEIDVVDVPRLAVARMQLDTDSLAPRQVVFAPRGSGRQLVAVTFEKGVTLFDALSPALAPRRISVRPQGSTAEVSIAEALFAPQARFLYLRATGLDDVVVAELTDTGARIEASLNFLGGGVGLSDIELPLAAGQEEALLAVYGSSREAMLLDARGSQDRQARLTLADPLTRLHALPDGKVLLFGPNERALAAWDPAAGKSGAIALDATFRGTLFADELGRFVFEHPSTAGGAALSIVSLEEQETRLRLHSRSVQLSSPATAFAARDGAGRIFLGVSSDQPYLVRLDLASLELGQVALDVPAAGLLMLSAGQQVAVLHGGDPAGDLTFVPVDDLERSKTERVVGWALTGDLDRPEDG